MSSYDTVDRILKPDVAVRVYCEVPMDKVSLAMAVELDLGRAAAYLNTDDAIRVATALLVAAQRAKQRAIVDGLVGGTATEQRCEICSGLGHRPSDHCLVCGGGPYCQSHQVGSDG